METIKILGEANREIRCPYECDGGDVTIDPHTRICKVCKRIFNIEETEFTIDSIILPEEKNNKEK